MVIFVVLYKVALTFASVDEYLNCDHSNETIKQTLPVLLLSLGTVSDSTITQARFKLFQLKALRFCTTIYYAVLKAVVAFEST